MSATSTGSKSPSSSSATVNIMESPSTRSLTRTSDRWSTANLPLATLATPQVSRVDATSPGCCSKRAQTSVRCRSNSSWIRWRNDRSVAGSRLNLDTASIDRIYRLRFQVAVHTRIALWHRLAPRGIAFADRADTNSVPLGKTLDFQRGSA